jgi:hypothetical protein
MKLNIPIRPLLIWLLAFPAVVYSQVSNDTTFNSLTSFESPDNIWSDVADVVINPNKFESFKKTSGSGIILAEAEKKESYLATKTAFGDVELEFDFLLGKATLSAVLLQGRYRLNLSDSWAQLSSSSNSMGGIGQLNAQDSSGFSGVVPLMNVAKAPGLWQHVRIRFKAPQFANGSKTANAYFEEVYINDCLVQQNIELQGPSAGSKSANEESTGPIVFYSSNGIIALKNFKARKFIPVTNTRPGGRRRAVNPIIITPEGTNYLLRSFLNFNNKKRTHVISVGSPQQVNYSYDLKQGALLQVWNGPFVDATEMWEQRGGNHNWPGHLAVSYRFLRHLSLPYYRMQMLSGLILSPLMILEPWVIHSISNVIPALNTRQEAIMSGTKFHQEMKVGACCVS